MKRIAVVGAGAVGCYFGGLLAQAGHAVVLIGRARHVEAIRARGLRWQTASQDRYLDVEASEALEVAAGADIVLFCVKSTDTDAVAAALAPVLAPGTVVVGMQNGVGNVARIDALLPQCRVVGSVVYVATAMAGDGHVRHFGRGELVLGTLHRDRLPGPALPASGSDEASTPSQATTPSNPDGSPAPTAAWRDDLGRTLESAGIPVQWSQQILGDLWAKLVANCAWNALSAITQLPYGTVHAGRQIEAIMRDVVQECIAVASAQGVVIPGDPWANVQQIATTMPGQFSSTAQDLGRGRPTEIDHLNGYVVREGERLGIATPANRVLQGLVLLLESHRLPALRTQ